MKKGEKNTERITIDLKGLRARLENWASDPEQTAASMVRAAINSVLDIWESARDLNLPVPLPGRSREWLEHLLQPAKEMKEMKEAIAQLGLPKPEPGHYREWLETVSRTNVIVDNLPTIASLVSQKDLVELSDKTRITEKRLTQIAQGDKPLLAELCLLELGLDEPLETLQAIYRRQFENKKESSQNA